MSKKKTGTTPPNSRSCLSARQYDENRKYAFHYEKSKDPERYYKDHRDQLALAWGAKDRLENAGINPKTMNLHEIEDHLNELNADRKKENTAYRSAEKECEKLKQFRDSLSAFMGNEQSQELNHEKNQIR